MPVPAVKAANALRAGRPQLRRYRTLLRFGVGPMLVGADLIAATVAGAVVPGAVADDLLVGLIFLSSLFAAGLYRSRLSLSVLDDLPAVASRGAAAVAATATLAALVIDQPLERSLLLVVVALVGCCLALRAVCYASVHWARRSGLVSHSTLVLGAGRVGGQLTTLLGEHPEYGLRPVGFLDDDPLLDEADRPVPLLGDVSSLALTILEFDVRSVIVAFGNVREPKMVEVLRTCDRLGVDIFLVPRLFELQHPGSDVDQVWGIPLVRRRRGPFRSLSWRLKRGLDVAVAGTALALLSPLMAVCALLVRLEGGPGVLFRQQRVGLDGRPFWVLKFRSLKPVDEAESQTQWNIAHDDRLGRFGALMRKTSLDELPQLWNIVRGDMSLVGPRPERPHFVARFQDLYPSYVARHRVPAGLTGWAQVHGLRGDTSIEDRARFDNYYIENWSLWLDIKILARTALAVVRGTGS